MLNNYKKKLKNDFLEMMYKNVITINYKYF